MWYHSKDDPIGIYRITFFPVFKFNILFVKDVHSKYHFWLCCAATFFLTGFLSPLIQSIALIWFLGLAWEIGDGFKPLWNTVPEGTSYIEENLFYADGFSWSDWIVYDTGGVILGTILGSMIW